MAAATTALAEWAVPKVVATEGCAAIEVKSFGALRELNLTDEQVQQQLVIAQRHVESIKSQREELSTLREKRMQGTFSADDEARAKALRQEIDNSRRRMLTEIEGILTPEQRTRLEQIKSERKLQHEEMRKRRGERESTPLQ